MPTHVMGEKSIETPPGKPKKPAKVLDHLRVREGEDGGHIIEHHFTSFEHEPEHHVFGSGEGEDTLAHIAKHAHIKLAEPREDEAAAGEGKGGEEKEPE